MNFVYIKIQRFHKSEITRKINTLIKWHCFWNRILKIFLYNQISFLQCDISSRIYNVFWEKIWFSWKTVSTKHSRAYKLCYGAPFQFCIYSWLFLWWGSHRSSISYFWFNSVGKLDCCYFTDPEFYFSLGYCSGAMSFT